MEIIKSVMSLVKDIIETVFGGLFKAIGASTRSNARLIIPRIISGFKRKIPIAFIIVLACDISDMINDSEVFFDNLLVNILMFVPYVIGIAALLTVLFPVFLFFLRALGVIHEAEEQIRQERFKGFFED